MSCATAPQLRARIRTRMRMAAFDLARGVDCTALAGLRTCEHAPLSMTGSYGPLLPSLVDSASASCRDRSRLPLRGSPGIASLATGAPGSLFSPRRTIRREHQLGMYVV